MRIFVPLFVAIQFLTRIPVRLASMPTEQEVSQSLRYYPIVGVLIGLLLAVLSVVLDHTSDMVRAVVILTAWIAITGALHLDGLADSADAWAGGFGNREKTLAIMKDPYCGPVAVVVLIMVLLIKFVALITWPSTQAWLLIMVPVIARALVVLLFLTTPYVRSHGLGAALAEQRSFKKELAILCGLAMLMLWFTGSIGAILLSVGLVCFYLLRRMMLNRLEGTTGDTAGATIELIEAALLLSFVLI